MPEKVGRYELGDVIASDATSRTYLSLADGQPVHVRVALLPELTDALRERFEADARAAASLSHENILRVLDHGLSGDRPFVVVPAVEGKTLRALLASEPGRRLPPDVVATIALDVAAALAHAHGQPSPVLHRCVSPDAIEIDGAGVARIASFALPSLSVAAAAAHPHLAEHTCRYGAPEQAKHQRTSAASDVFALGATLYEALAGKPAFDAPTPLATTLKISTGVHVSVDLAAPTAPGKLRSLVTSMLATGESERPRASDLAAALAELAGSGGSRRAAVSKRVRALGGHASGAPQPAPASARHPEPPLAAPSPWPSSPPAAAPEHAPWGASDGEPVEDLPTENTRLDALPDAPSTARDEAPLDEATELPGEATTWDTQLPEAPMEATSPALTMPFESDEGARPLTVEKTVQIAMPAAAAAMFLDGRPTLPVDAAAAAAAAQAARAAEPSDPAELSAAGTTPSDYRSPYGGPSALALVAIGVGAVAAVALVAFLAVWLVQ